MAELSQRPYLLRAMVEWMIDCGHTPHAIVDATQDGVEVPRAFVNDGKIVLNISPSATQGLMISATSLTFNARFSGVVHHVDVPIDAVLGIYARETGHGMKLTGDLAGERPDTDPPEGGPGVPPSTPGPGSPAGKRSQRPKLTVIK